MLISSAGDDPPGSKPLEKEKKAPSLKAEGTGTRHASDGQQKRRNAKVASCKSNAVHPRSVHRPSWTRRTGRQELSKPRL